MQTVTADATNSRNKQKSSQLQTNSSRKFQKNKKLKYQSKLKFHSFKTKAQKNVEHYKRLAKQVALQLLATFYTQTNQ